VNNFQTAMRRMYLDDMAWPWLLGVMFAAYLGSQKGATLVCATLALVLRSSLGRTNAMAGAYQRAR
jgi:hypothetical protein